MLKKLLPTVLAGLLLSSNSAIAAQDMTFARWVAACSLLSDSTLQTVDAGTCLGYTQGVLDAAHLAEPEQEALFCDPRDTVVVRDYVELGQKWAAENPAGLEGNAAFQLMLAFKFYLPCDEEAENL
tara:strand:- start:28831 stop:29208 length:378 start_codon:yes stop_codon:yes gene_type:complete